MFKKFWSSKAFILSLESAFIFSFFVGIFQNWPLDPEKQNQRYDNDYHFYIGRGLPIAWAGVSDASKRVDFPIIKAPFLQMNNQWVGSPIVKIVDLRIFIPLFLFSFLASIAVTYPFYFVFARAGEENKPLGKITIIPLFIFLTLGCFFAYFFWFPRI